MHLATRLDRYAPCCMRLWRCLVLLLVHVSIGTAHRPAHANGLGFFVGKGEIFQVLALPYVLLPTPVEDPYGTQSVLNILDLQSGAIYACMHPHQCYDALPLFFGYVHVSTPLHQFPNHLRRHRRHAGSCGPAVAGRGSALSGPSSTVSGDPRSPDGGSEGASNSRIVRACSSFARASCAMIVSARRRASRSSASCSRSVAISSVVRSSVGSVRSVVCSVGRSGPNKTNTRPA